MPGPLIRPPTKKELIIGGAALALGVGIMGLAGSTGHLASEVREQALASSSPAPSTAADCRSVVTDLTDQLIMAQDALNEAASGGDYSKTDLQAAADVAKKAEAGAGLASCKKADAATGEKIAKALTAMQDAPTADLKTKADDLLKPIADVLALAR